MVHMKLWASPIALENMDMECDLLETVIIRDGRNVQVSVLSFKSEEKCLCHF